MGKGKGAEGTGDERMEGARTSEKVWVAPAWGRFGVRTQRGTARFPQGYA